MSRFKVTWNYSTMKSTFTGINATDGVFGVTVESEWKAVPRKSFAQRLLVSTLLARPARYVNPKMKFSMMGSLHKYFFDVRSTGISSCHVAISDNVLLALPTMKRRSTSWSLICRQRRKMASPKRSRKSG